MSVRTDRVFHHHIVEIMQQLIAAIKDKGPGADIDMSDVGQRESFDTIGAVALCASGSLVDDCWPPTGCSRNLRVLHLGIAATKCD